MAVKQSVNYLLQHQEANIRLSQDDVSPIDISIYNALFLIWNHSKWAEILSINRQDVMKMAKVGNKNTYTDSMKRLHEKGYISYNPSHNPLVGSLVTITTFGKSGYTINGISSGKSSGKTDGNTTGNGSGTLYKLLETEETEKQIETLKNKLSSAEAEVSFLKKELGERDSEIKNLKKQIENSGIQIGIPGFQVSSVKNGRKPRVDLEGKFLDVYSEWMKSCHQMPAKIDGTQVKAARRLIEHLRKMVDQSASDKEITLLQTDQEDRILKGWGWFLSRWLNLDPFYQDKVLLTEIDSKFPNLYKQALNGTAKQQSTTKSGQGGAANSQAQRIIDRLNGRA